MKIFSIITFCLLLCTTFSHADLTDGLVLYMPLDEGSGTAVQDLSPNGFEGEVMGNAKWVAGQHGQALQFAAAADHVLIEDDAAFHIEGAITQAAWVNLDRLPSAHAIIFGTRQSAATRHIGFGFGMNPANGIKVWTNGAGGGFKDINDNETELETGKWYHLAYTHTDDSNGLVEIYVDGEVTHSEESGNPVAPAANTSAVTIGTWGGEAWTGTVDEVQLWNRVLSADEIKMSMDPGLTPVEPQGKLTTSWANIKSNR